MHDTANAADYSDEITADLTHIAFILSQYNGRMGEFTPDHLGPMWDPLDTMAHEEARRRMGGVARRVCNDSGAVAVAYLCLSLICASDPWATKEVPGRFLSAARRIALATKVSRHRNAHRFDSLIRAIERGRATKAQMDFATRLASEVRA
jgi:hypothetical protein